MSADSRRPQDRDPVLSRLDELLADRATQGLSLDDERELDRLLSDAGDVDDEAFDRAAAAADLALGPQRFEPMPAELRDKIAASRIATLQASRRPVLRSLPAESNADGGQPARRERPPFVLWSGWVAAIAASLIALFATRPAPESPITKPPPSIVEEVAGAKDALKVAWKPMDDPAGKLVHGDVMWSNAMQKGFVRLAGLPKNDPAKRQYQLWIFCKTRDDRYPVDGGVFDVDAATGDVIVPFHAELRIAEPKMFALTIEQPGGVVVSAREHLVAVASL
jgi:anti-sigma-K factor RskA